MAKTSKNKTKMWRRMAVKGYGRKLKAAMAGVNHPAGPTTIIASLMKRGGIETPNFDKQTVLRHNNETINKGVSE